MTTQAKQDKGQHDQAASAAGTAPGLHVLACVGKETAYRPIDVYQFFKREDVEFIQW